MNSGDPRLDRQFDLIARQIPVSAGFLRWVRQPGLALIRVPLSLLLIAGGIFSFLPVLGIWMLPLGLLLLAIDVPPLRRPIGNVMVRLQRWLALRRRQLRRR